jgi:hypothetical protein
MMEINTDNAAAQQAIEKNYRWNFLVNTMDGASFWFGMSFFHPRSSCPCLSAILQRAPWRSA